jgi:hypothetical protein
LQLQFVCYFYHIVKNMTRFGLALDIMCFDGAQGAKVDSCSVIDNVKVNGCFG